MTQTPVRTRDGAATRARIEKEALRLFAEHGVEGTSIKDIAHAVGVADAALYRHFPSKDEIARALFCSHYIAIAEKIEAIGRAPRPFDEVVRDLVDLLCALFDDEPDVFAFVLLSQHAHLRFVPERPNVVSALRDIVMRAQARGEIAESDADLAAAMALGTVLQPAVFKLYGRLPGPMRALAPQMTDAALRVLRTASY
ncbi:MAG: TetR/AcrR family transcriptional regulator [Beijerinckiaceae bacterium]|jgi:AcrR family transcriptional regulator|nr:TetR/AcrR family transcriptional regulator [Beijerinckiaceae bacterium]